jgi:predicted transcriptional regulator of viral defense system
MSESIEISEKIIELAKKQGVIQIRDLRKEGIHPEYLRRLYEKGRLVKLARGQYALPELKISENHSLSIVGKSVPNANICLLSALRFYNIGTQAPYEVWIAIQNRTAKPQIRYPKLRVFYYSGMAYSEGIEEHLIDSVQVKIYSPAKTIADCFKYRNKIGIDVAIEALRDGWQQNKFNMDELWKFAKICRVTNVMKPYMESLT